MLYIIVLTAFFKILLLTGKKKRKRFNKLAFRVISCFGINQCVCPPGCEGSVRAQRGLWSQDVRAMPMAGRAMPCQLGMVPVFPAEEQGRPGVAVRFN